MSDQARSEIHQNRIAVKWALVIAACVILLAVYLFQQFNFLLFFCGSLAASENCSFHPNTIFIFNKTFRLIVNDTACMILILALFKERKYLRVAFYIFLFELLIVLPLYFILKLTLEGDSEISSPLLSQIHRMIVNPTLMILVIIAFSYQRFKSGSGRHEL